MPGDTGKDGLQSVIRRQERKTERIQSAPPMGSWKIRRSTVQGGLTQEDSLRKKITLRIAEIHKYAALHVHLS